VQLKYLYITITAADPYRNEKTQS